MMGRHGRNLRLRQRDAKREAERRELARTMMIQRLTNDLKSTLDRARSAEDFNREVATIVGRTAIVAGAPTHMMFDSLTRQYVRERGLRMVPRQPMPDMAYLGLPMESYPLEEIRAEVMRMLDYDVVLEPLRRAMHVKVTLADGEVRYTISEHALRTMERPQLVRNIAHELAVALADKLRRAGQPAFPPKR